VKEQKKIKLFILAYYGSAPTLWIKRHARNLLPHRKSSTQTIDLIPADVAVTYSCTPTAWKETYWCLGIYRYVWDVFYGTSLVANQIPSFIWWYKFRWPVTMGLSFFTSVFSKETKTAFEWWNEWPVCRDSNWCTSTQLLLHFYHLLLMLLIPIYNNL